LSYGFSVLKFNDIAEVFSGIKYKTSDLKNQGQASFFRPRDIVENKITKTSKWVDQDYVAENRSKLLKEGDILIQNIFEYHKMALIGKNDLPAFASNNLFIIRSHKIDPKFLFNYLKSDTIKQQLLSELDQKSSRATIKRISLKQFKEIKIPIPNAEDQIKWYTNIESFTLPELQEIGAKLVELKKSISDTKNQGGIYSE